MTGRHDVGIEGLLVYVLNEEIARSALLYNDRVFFIQVTTTGTVTVNNGVQRQTPTTLCPPDQDAADDDDDTTVDRHLDSFDTTAPTRDDNSFVVG